jgi:hypothetical protein
LKQHGNELQLGSEPRSRGRIQRDFVVR